jgi:hypothetical protein
MTDQPPPPPGNYPPPPPPPGGYPPPPPPQGGGYPPPPGGGYQAPQAATSYPPPAAAGPALPKEAYTPWLTRVLAWIIDFIPVFILEGIGYGLLLGTRETACITDTSEYDLGEFCATGASTLGQTSFIITWVLSIAYLIWNYGYRQGTTGSSIGKSIMKFKVVSEKTGQPIGFDRAPAGALHRQRDLLHRLLVPAVGRQAADDRRQDHDDYLLAALDPTSTDWKVL